MPEFRLIGTAREELDVAAFDQVRGGGREVRALSGHQEGTGPVHLAPQVCQSERGPDRPGDRRSERRG